MQKYVLGFMFSLEKDKVILIEKLKPAWQKGLLNGVGGKVEDYDQSSLEAMVREFKEETGVCQSEWIKLLTVSDEKDFSVDVFYCFSDRWDECSTQEAEQVVFKYLHDLPELLNTNQIISNVPWMVMACLDGDVRTKRLKIQAQYY